MSTANEEYLDASIRHAIDVRRFQVGLVRKIIPFLEAADKDLVAKLRKRLGEIGLPLANNDLKYQRILAMIHDIQVARAELFKKINDETSAQLEDFAQLEAHVEEDLLAVSIPIAVRFATISLKSLAALADKDPFQGALLSGWFKQLSENDQQRVRQAIVLGVTSGETIDDMIVRLVGTKKNKFQDGILSVGRRNAEAVVRTAVNSVSNAAREQVWDANSDIIEGVRWVSTLDGRTSAICRARDGQEFPVNSGPRPPAHWNCRSITVAILRGLGIIGDRPFVVDIRRNSKRQIDFRAEANKTGKTIQEVRSSWAEANIGQTPATTTYNEWLGRQSATFQDSVLGPTRGKLFRDGGLNMDQFVDRLGNQINLNELKQLYPDAWTRVQKARQP